MEKKSKGAFGKLGATALALTGEEPKKDKKKGNFLNKVKEKKEKKQKDKEKLLGIL